MLSSVVVRVSGVNSQLTGCVLKASVVTTKLTGSAVGLMAPC